MAFDIETMDCICRPCIKDMGEGLGPGCEILMAMQYHLTEVVALMAASTEKFKMLVGPMRKEVTGYRVLLGFYSKYFNGLLYNRFAEAGQRVIELPDDRYEEVAAFVKWTLTGDIYTCHENIGDPAKLGRNIRSSTLRSPDVQRLWVMGDRLMAPSFANQVMLLIMRKYNKHFLSPAAAKYVFKYAPSGSKPRKFTRDLIFAVGPLNETYDRRCFNKKAWARFMMKGGEMLWDCRRKGFHNRRTNDRWDNEKNRPWLPKKQYKYLQDEDDKTPEDWLAHKTTSQLNRS